MENGVKLFESAEFGKVRVIMRNGEPWFVASDVAKVLGYENPANAINTHCKKSNKITLSPDLGGRTASAHIPPVSVNIIPESDVYRLVMRSNLESAERFQDWVCDEVLPSIRKTGGYAIGISSDKKEIAPDMEQLTGALLKFYSAYYEDKNQLMLTVNKGVKNAVGIDMLALGQVELVAPVQSQLLTPTLIGKYLEPPLSGKKVNKRLEELGYQTRTNGLWSPTSKGVGIGALFVDTGKCHGDGAPVRQLKWPVSIVDWIKTRI